MITGIAAKRSHAWHATYEERQAAQKEARRLELVEECIQHIGREERPFRHDYWTESHHNGDPYQTHDIVWAKVKPVAKDKDEKYTLIEMPEYEEAMRRIEAASDEPVEEAPDPWP